MVELGRMFYLCSYHISGEDMERKRQLSNVAFGGDWSEGIEPAERIADALACLERAVDAAKVRNPLNALTLGALEFVTTEIVRGHLLKEAFLRAGRIQHPELRQAELRRGLKVIKSLVGKAACR